MRHERKLYCFGPDDVDGLSLELEVVLVELFVILLMLDDDLNEGSFCVRILESLLIRSNAILTKFPVKDIPVTEAAVIK